MSSNLFTSVYYAGKIPSAASDLKTTSLQNGNIAIAFSAPTNSKGELLNPNTELSPRSTARVYSSNVVRVWDTWNTPYQRSLFYSSLTLTGTKYWLNNEMVNALTGTGIQYPNFAGGMLGEGGCFDLSAAGVLLNVLLPEQNLAQKLVSGLYYISLASMERNDPKVYRIKIPDWTGDIESPKFSHHGIYAACIIDKNPEGQPPTQKAIAILQIDGSSQGPEVRALYTCQDGTKKAWDRLPGSLLWANDNKTLYIQAEDTGSVCLFQVELDFGACRDVTASIPEPKRLAGKESITSAHILSTNNIGETRLFVNSTSFVESSLYRLLDPTDSSHKHLSSASNSGADLGLNEDQITSLTYKSGKECYSQAWVVRPSKFDKSRRYPVTLIIHGGPTGALNNVWNARWNAAVFAEQGYIVVMPNFVGSTGFGIDFMDKVMGDWARRPYEDIAACFEHLQTLDYVDTASAVALGYSYGGFMMNLIAGQPLGKKLKALVCHSGVFSNLGILSSDLVGGLDIYIGSKLWENARKWEEDSSHLYTKNWSTPMLISHSDMDFRCPISEGLLAYNVCQAKGIESRFLRFPDEGHYILGRENSLEWYRVVLGWINKYSGAEGSVKP